MTIIAPSLTTVSRAYKYRLKPTPSLQAHISAQLNANRFVWNHLLGLIVSEFEARRASIANGLTPDYIDYSANRLSKLLTDLKAGNLWLYNHSSTALQQTVIRLHKAFTATFSRYKATQRMHMPRFKSRYDMPGSFEIAGLGSIRFTSQTGLISTTGRSIGCTDLQVVLPKTSESCQIAWTRPLPSVPSSYVVSRDATGRHYISFRVLVPRVIHYPTTLDILGIDVGIKSLAIGSNGITLAPPPRLLMKECRLQRYQRQMARRQRAPNQPKSANYIKAQQQTARLYSRVTHIRTDYVNQAAMSLVSGHSTVVLEDFNLAFMTSNRHLSKATQRTLIGRLRQRITDILERTNNGLVIVADKLLPSSHICSHCGTKKPNKLSLSDCTWQCHHCYITHDRDFNASQVLAKYGRLAIDSLRIKGSPRPIGTIDGPRYRDIRSSYGNLAI